MTSTGSALRYAITDLAGSGGNTALARQQLFEAWLQRCLKRRVSFLQLREKSLDTGELLQLATFAMRALHPRPAASRPRLLLNHRADIAVAAGADGVHLTGRPGELSPAQVQAIFAASGNPAPFVSLSCHTPAEAAAARERGATIILFGPVFGKQVAGNPVTAAVGLDALRAAVAAAGPVPVLALGGVTPQLTDACLAAGAAGVAGIRLFA